MVIPPYEGGLEEALDVDNNIIILDSTLRIILTPQLKNISACYKVYVRVWLLHNFQKYAFFLVNMV